MQGSGVMLASRRRCLHALLATARRLGIRIVCRVPRDRILIRDMMGRHLGGGSCAHHTVRQEQDDQQDPCEHAKRKHGLV